MDAEYPAAHLKFVNLTVPSQGYLKMPNGRALTGQSHDYIRHGVTTLFAAFDIATGKVTGRQYKRRRRVEFLDFMNRVVAQHEGREIHVISTI
jgi:hypothetical protein